MHYDALTKNGRRVYDQLGKADFLDNFYLAGGTALALQIGHRISVDLDFFSSDPIKKNLLQQVEGLLGDKFSLETRVNNSGELTLVVDDVKVTFLHYPFCLLFDLERTDGLSFLSPKEIGVTKAYTIGRRGEYKDYIDLYFLLKQKHTTLVELMTLAEQKYSQAFNSKLFLEQLLYEGDVEEVEIEFLQSVVSRRKLSAFFREQISKIKLE
ncbi:MAG: nucleotidyl transferase AbiEii/AbiGii toxin family protein [Candidatus Paceibacterota bacterium]